MGRFLLSFLTSFTVFYFLFSKKIIEIEVKTEEKDDNFIKSDTGKLINILKEFNKMKNEI
ncbi:hypothetical protein [Persephonella sp.]